MFCDTETVVTHVQLDINNGPVYYLMFGCWARNLDVMVIVRQGFPGLPVFVMHMRTPAVTPPCKAHKLANYGNVRSFSACVHTAKCITINNNHTPVIVIITIYFFVLFYKGHVRKHAFWLAVSSLLVRKLVSEAISASEVIFRRLRCELTTWQRLRHFIF
jgi:hypothetical protein